MINAHPLHQLKEQVASTIGIESVGDRIFTVDVPLSFPDGDQCRIHVTHQKDGSWQARDNGISIMRASYSNDVNVRGTGYAARFQQILDLYDLSDADGELVATSGDVGKAVFTIAQASLDIVNLARMPKEKPEPKRSDFNKKLSQIVHSAFKNRNDVEENWCDLQRDEDHLYPVTYRTFATNGKPPLFIFGASTQNSCMHSTMSCLFHKNAGTPFTGVAIFKDEGRLPKQEAMRLKNEVDQSFPSITDRDAIQRFLTEAV